MLCKARDAVSEKCNASNVPLCRGPSILNPSLESLFQSLMRQCIAQRPSRSQKILNWRSTSILEYLGLAPCSAASKYRLLIAAIRLPGTTGQLYFGRTPRARCGHCVLSDEVTCEALRRSKLLRLNWYLAASLACSNSIREFQPMQNNSVLKTLFTRQIDL